MILRYNMTVITKQIQGGRKIVHQVGVSSWRSCKLILSGHLISMMPWASHQAMSKYLLYEWMEDIRLDVEFHWVSISFFLNSAEILRVKFTSFIHMYPMDTQRVLCLWTQHILPNLMQDLYSLPYLDSIKLALGQSSDNIINMSITQYFINNANKYKLCKDSHVP